MCVSCFGLVAAHCGVHLFCHNYTHEGTVVNTLWSRVAAGLWDHRVFLSLNHPYKRLRIHPLCSEWAFSCRMFSLLQLHWWTSLRHLSVRLHCSSHRSASVLPSAVSTSRLSVCFLLCKQSRGRGRGAWRSPGFLLPPVF